MQEIKYFLFLFWFPLHHTSTELVDIRESQALEDSIKKSRRQYIQFDIREIHIIYVIVHTSTITIEYNLVTDGHLSLWMASRNTLITPVPNWLASGCKDAGWKTQHIWMDMWHNAWHQKDMAIKGKMFMKVWRQS